MSERIQEINLGRWTQIGTIGAVLSIGIFLSQVGMGNHITYLFGIFALIAGFSSNWSA